MAVGNDVPSSRRMAAPRSKSAPTNSGTFALACNWLVSTAVGYAWLFTMPSGEPCVMLMNPPTCRSFTQCSICAYAAASVEVKLPWYVAKRTWPIFSSTVILRSVASAHCEAAGEGRCDGLPGSEGFFLAAPGLAVDERLCVRAVWAIRKMIAAGISNRTPTRPFLKCESPPVYNECEVCILHTHIGLTTRARMEGSTILLV